MAKRHAEEEGHENSERWLLTYSDLITLLMIFFVVLYSMSMIDSNKFIAMANALGISLGSGPKIVMENTSFNGVLPDGNPGTGNAEETQMEDTEKKMKDYAANNNLGSLANIYMDDRGLVVSLNEVLLFELGSADVSASAEDILKKIAGMISILPNYVTVEGFTDDLPIKTAKFPSNWELASQRAINVAKILVDNGVDPEKMSARSYGEFRPAYPNINEDNRKRNRRVDIIVMKSEHNKLEPQMNNGNPNSNTTLQPVIPNGTTNTPTVPGTNGGSGSSTGNSSNSNTNIQPGQ